MFYSTNLIICVFFVVVDHIILVEEKKGVTNSIKYTICSKSVDLQLIFFKNERESRVIHYIKLT